MSITLNTYERVTLSQWLGSGSLKGDINQLRNIMALMDKLELTKEEQASVGLVQHGGTFIWRDSERTFDIEVTPEELAVLRRALESEWAATPATLDMLEKLEDML